MKKIPLIIESVETDSYWGRVQFEDNLLVENAASISMLEKKMKSLLKEWHNVEITKISFDLQYDIAGLFDEKKYLNSAVIAERAGINKSLMRQYASGLKFPSMERAKEIEKVIHEMGKEMLVIKLSGRMNSKSAQKAYS